jgi:signal transduction histidine kinase/ligand-binding sensor domain-containing protein
VVIPANDISDFGPGSAVGVHCVKHVVIWVAGVLVFASARAQEFSPNLQQLNHRGFTRLEGAPTSVFSIAQTTDGSLWLGSTKGLTRFDGTKFVTYPEKSDDPLPSSNVSALLSSPDGGLWIGFRLGGVCFLRNGHLTRYGASEGLPQSTVYRFAYDRDGALLMATSAGLLQLRGRVAQRIASDVIGRAVDVLLDHSGTLWVATGDNVVAQVSNDAPFHEVGKIKQPYDTYSQMLAEAPDGHVWALSTGLLTRLDLTTPGSGGLPVSASKTDNGRMLIDRRGNVWWGNNWLSDAGSVSRWPANNVAADTQSQVRVAHAEVFSKADGLTGTPISIAEDREHNIWMGTLSGLDRFSPSRVVRTLPRCHGLGYALTADAAGDLWAACGDILGGDKSSLSQMRDGKVIAERPAEPFTAAYRDPDGIVWFGGPNQVASFDGDAFNVTPLPDDLRGRDVQALAKDGSGALWVSVVRHGVYRLDSGQWVPYGATGLPREPAIVETSDDAGGIWFGYAGNRLVRLQGQVLQQFNAADGLDVGNVTAIHLAAGHVWIGGEVGLSQLHDGHFHSMRTASGTPIKGISGIASTKNGDLWLNATDGIVRIGSEDVQRLIQDPNYPIQPETFDNLDGVPGEATQLRPTPSAIATTDGRVWFATAGGLVWIDAAGSSKNNLAPPIRLRALFSGGQRYPNRGDDTLDLPVHARSLQFEYSAGSLMVPEHVRFRYRLTGLDRDWQDAGGRREAFYTNLGPGAYTFQVIGCNNDGVWNETGASMAFTIEPAFYQTNWFYALCVAAVLVLIWALVQLRLRQLHKHHEALNQSRLELAHVERLATLSTMTASITHEVSQPISGILTNTNTCVRMLAADPPNVEGATETARRTIRDANRAAEVIKRLRAMFAKKAPTMEMVDLNDAARDVISISSAQLRRGGAVLETDFADSLPPVSGDRVQLQQVMLNLLLNAADAMAGIEDREKMIRVQTQLEGGDKVKLLVRDSGVGLDPRDIEKLFEAFHTTKEHGLGVGLAISRSIIESHKGQLWAMANDGPGATFGFSIPCARGAMTEPAAMTSSSTG